MERKKNPGEWSKLLLGFQSLKSTWKLKWGLSDKHFNVFDNNYQKFSVKIRFIMYTSILKNLVKKLQIATDTKFKRGQTTFQGDKPFCICWQELASVFRCNILSVAEEALRRNVAGKSSKRRQSQVCKMWKWASIRLPPLSKTYYVCTELSEVRK